MRDVLVTGAGALIAWAPFLQFLAFTKFAGASLIGGVLYPLARTVMESTDSTSPFAGRLRTEFERPSNYLRVLVVGGASVGAGVAVAVGVAVDVAVGAGAAGADRSRLGSGVGVVMASPSMGPVR